MPVSDKDRILKILGQHTDKNFVQRILTPEVYPKMDFGNGSYGTHLMAWGEFDGKPIVYPSIVYDNGQLTKLNSEDAFNHAIKTNQFIPFNTNEEADWFSQNYKKVWE